MESNETRFAEILARQSPHRPSSDGAGNVVHGSGDLPVWWTTEDRNSLGSLSARISCLAATVPCNLLIGTLRRLEAENPGSSDACRNLSELIYEALSQRPPTLETLENKREETEGDPDQLDILRKKEFEELKALLEIVRFKEPIWRRGKTS